MEIGGAIRLSLTPKEAAQMLRALRAVSYGGAAPMEDQEFLRRLHDTLQKEMG